MANIAGNQLLKKEYWYYSNDSYERKTETYANGVTIQLNRNVTGPAPSDYIKAIVQSVNHQSPNWKNQVVTLLQANHFNTQSIIAGQPTEAGVTKKGFLKSFLNWKTAAKTIAVVATVGLVFVAPSFVTLQKEGSLFNSAVKGWKNIGTKILESSTLAQTVISITIMKSSQFLYEKLNETLGPKGFQAWKAAKFDEIFQDPHWQMIPPQHHNDPVLSQNICPITACPIRVPCRSPWGHIYEEAAIKAWITNQIQNGLQPQDPFRNGVLHHHQLTIDTNLSDTIELRLLIL